MPGKHVSASPRRERRRGPQHERLLVGGGSPRGLPDDSGRSWGSEDAVLGAYGPAALPQERTQCARGPVLRGPRGWLTRREPTAVEGAFGSVALKPGRFCRLRQNSGARARAEDGAVGAQGVASPPGPRLSQAAGAGCATPRERGRGRWTCRPRPFPWCDRPTASGFELPRGIRSLSKLLETRTGPRRPRADGAPHPRGSVPAHPRATERAWRNEAESKASET